MRRLLAEAERPPAPEGPVLFLIGGYDGSGNYGDMLQLQATLELLAGAPVTPVPVLELPFRGSHADVAAASPQLDAPVCWFSEAAVAPEGFRRWRPAPDAGWAGAYLYGGGYVNPAWGPAKLAMAEAAEAVARAAGLPWRAPLSSGLQVDVAWAEEAPLLRTLRPFGVRDEGSIPAFAADPLLTGDDAVGVLAAHAGTARADEERVNVHLQEGDWVTEDPDALVDFVAALLRGLGDPPVQPVIAYDDRRVSERPIAERLAARCRVAEPPLVMRPGDLGAALAQLGRAKLTISCSYHVALTSDLIGVPAALMAGNAYYEQKAAGLAAQLGLPDAFTVRPGAEAGALLGALPEARAALARSAPRLVERRRAAEREILARLARHAEGGETAEERLAALRSQHDRLLAAADDQAAQLAERDARIERLWEEMLGYKARAEAAPPVKRPAWRRRARP